MRRILAATAAAVAMIAVVPSGVSGAAPASTTITMSVTGCEGCVITPARTPADSTDVYNGPKATVRNGVATFVVPTAQTSGMYFSIDTDKPTQINAVPLIVFQYKGAAPGTTVTKAQGRAYKRASPCWTGTTAATAAISVTVARVLMPAFVPGKPNSHKKTAVPMAWVVPTLSAPAPFWPLVKGVLATQDSVACGS